MDTQPTSTVTQSFPWYFFKEKMVFLGQSISSYIMWCSTTVFQCYTTLQEAVTSPAFTSAQSAMFWAVSSLVVLLLATSITFLLMALALTHGIGLAPHKLFYCWQQASHSYSWHWPCQGASTHVLTMETAAEQQTLWGQPFNVSPLEGAAKKGICGWSRNKEIGAAVSG